MGDELIEATGINGGLGGSWWSNPMIGLFSGGGLPSPCSAALGDFGWFNDMENLIKEKSSYFLGETISVSDSDHSSLITLQNPPPRPLPESSSSLVDSGLEILGFGFSPSCSTTDWNQQNIIDENNRVEVNYNPMLQDVASRLTNYGSVEMINQPYSMINSGDSSVDSTTTYAMIQSLLESDDHNLDCQISLFEDKQTVAYDSWPRVSQQLGGLGNDDEDMMISPLINKYLNTSSISNVGCLMNDARASEQNYSLSSSSTETVDERPCGTKLKSKKNVDKVRDFGLKFLNGNKEPSLKRPRVETPSSLPTFKVRKEKLGDRVTALQQLVSPFGKTDTASVLHEAIEYIKFLHDQVNVLSTPYLRKNGSSVPFHQQMINGLNEGSKQDLTRRGLCLVPISFTFPIAHETPVDFWTPTPTFG
ncbi:Transcription factor bHLH112-like protein [Drosera capensis]